MQSNRKDNSPAPEQKASAWDVSGADGTLDPLLDCLERITELYDRHTSPVTLSAGLPLINNRLTVPLFSRAAERAGLSSRLVKRSLKSITNLELPAVLLLDDYRAVVAVQTNRRHSSFRILVPESGMGMETISARDLGKQYSGHAIFVHPEYEPEDTISSELRTKPRSWFWGTLFSSWRLYRDVFAASFLINLFGLATPFFILNVYDRVVPNLAYETLWVLATGIGAIYLFELVMRSLRGYFVDIAGKKANLRLSAMLFEKALGLRMEVRPRSVGGFTKNLQEFDSVRDLITSLSITTLVDLPFVILGLIAINYIAQDMVWIQVTGMAALMIYSLSVQLPLKRAVDRSFEAAARKSAILVEGLTGIEEIKTLGAESQLQRKMEKAVAYIAKWGTYSRFFSSSVSHVSTFIQNIAVVAVVVAGVYMIGNGTLTQGGLIACVILSRRVISPISQVANLTTRFHRAKTALANLDRIVNLPVERPEGRSFLHCRKFKGAIEFSKVRFGYPEQGGLALNDLSFSIKAGESVAIIGPSGSGKSTLARLLLGLYRPDEGTVLIDGIDINQIDPAELRRYIGYLPQDVTLFHGSVQDNIRLGTHGISDDAVIKAAEAAGVSAFAKKHTMGYDMPVGERGRSLSGGQRQSVAIARALLLDPSILVLDEPTNSMDNHTEKRLKKRLTELVENKTLLLVTHRASLLTLVDRVIVLDHGTVVADGPKAQVLEAMKAGQLVV